MKYGKECVCGRGGECQGISAAFALLKDPRRGYVQLPLYTPEPTSYQERDMNAMRASYLRHLRRTEQSLGDSQTRRFVALHHFHPVVVQKHCEMPNAVSPIPKTLKKVDLKFLKMELGDEDRVRDEEGRKKKQYYFVPNWPIDLAKDDLKYLIRVSRIYQETRVGAPSPLTTPPATPSPTKHTIVAMGSSENALVTTPLQPRKLHDEDTEQTSSQDAPSAALEAKEAAMLQEEGTESPAQETSELTDEATEQELLATDGSQDDIINDVITSPPPADFESTAEVDAPAAARTMTTVSGDDEDTHDRPISIPASQSAKMQDQDEDEVDVEEGADEVKDMLPSELDQAKADEGKQVTPYILSSVPISERILEEELVEEKLPSHLTMESEEGRRFLFRRMSKFEAKRQEVCTPLVEEYVVLWTASLRVMQAGIFEMARAERLIRGAALANKAYAEAMQANFEDVYLDADGNAVTEKRKQSRIAKERESFSVESAGGSPEKFREPNSRSHMLGAIIDSQEVISEKFSENYESVNEHVVSELSNLRSYLKQEMMEFKRRGDPFIRDIQGSETEVQTAFAVFDIVGPSPGDITGLPSSHHSKRGFTKGSGTPVQAAGSYHGGPNSPSSLHGTPDSPNTPKGNAHSETSRSFFGRRQVGLKFVRGGSNHGSKSNHGKSASNHGSPSSNHGSPAALTPTVEEGIPQIALDPQLLSHATSPIAAALRNNAVVRDGWLIEMLYRQAVNAQVQILKKCGAQLEEIWQSMHRIEVNRRIRLHEVMLDFMPRQRRLYLGLAPVASPILENLVQQRTDPQTLDEQLDDEVRKHMQTLLKIDNAKRSSIMNRSRAQAPNLDDLHGMLTGEFFDNGMLRAAKIVERRTGVRGLWKTTLAVVTGDNYLHMFDVSFIPEVVIGSPAEPVFELLLPDYDIPGLDSQTVQRRVDSLLKHLTPIDTVDITKCSTSVTEDARTMEIVESRSKGLIGFDASRKFTLRTISVEETEQWIAFLQSCCQNAVAAGAGTSTDDETLLEEEKLVIKAVQSAEDQLARV